MTPNKLFYRLKSMFPEIKMGGSLMLKNYGLLQREPKDVDIVAHPDSRFIIFARQLASLSPSSNLNYYSPTDNHIRFKISGLDVCVFISDKPHTIQSVIDAKLSYAKKNTPSGLKHRADLKLIQNWLHQHQGICDLLISNKLINPDFVYNYLDFPSPVHTDNNLPF